MKGQVHTFKFSLLIIFSIVVTLVCVYTQIEDFKNKKEIYKDELIKAEKLKDTFRVYADLKIPILIAPNPLSIFAKGIEDKVGSKIEVSITDVPELQQTISKGNPFLSVFNAFDILTIVKIIFSLFTILLVSDVIVQEKEDHIFESIFVNSVSKKEYFLSKLSANLTTLLIPLLSIFLIALLYIIIDKEVSIEITDLIKVVLIFFCCLIYITIFILTGLILSTVCKSSDNAIMSGLFIWMFLVFIYPGAIKYITNRTMPLPSSQNISHQKEIIKYEAEQSFMNNFYNSIDWSISGGNMNLYFIAYEETSYKGLPRFIGVLQKYLLEGYIRALKKDFPELMDAQKRIEGINQKVVNTQIKQRIVISQFLFIDPTYLLEESTTILAGTDLIYRKINLEKIVKDYRNRVFSYLETKNAFDYRFFTWMDTNKMHDFTKEYSKKEVKNFEEDSNSLKLNIKDIPKFKLSKKFTFPIESAMLIFILLVVFCINIWLFDRI